MVISVYVVDVLCHCKGIVVICSIDVRKNLLFTFHAACLLTVLVKHAAHRFDSPSSLCTLPTSFNCIFILIFQRMGSIACALEAAMELRGRASGLLPHGIQDRGYITGSIFFLRNFLLSWIFTLSLSMHQISDVCSEGPNNARGNATSQLVSGDLRFHPRLFHLSLSLHWVRLYSFLRVHYTFEPFLALTFSVQVRHLSLCQRLSSSGRGFRSRLDPYVRTFLLARGFSPSLTSWHYCRCLMSAPGFVGRSSPLGKASCDATFCVGVSSSVLLTFERILANPEGLRSPRLSSTVAAHFQRYLLNRR